MAQSSPPSGRTDAVSGSDDDFAERLATLTAPERGALYSKLGLSVLERHTAEEAVRAAILRRLRRRAAL